MTENSAILFEIVRPNVAQVTINRPEARNAVNGAVAAGLEAAVARIEADTEIHVAILTAAGSQSFSAGADLREIAAGKGAQIVRENGGFAGFVQADRTKPWIAAVRGGALGGGLELCLACDLVVAAETARFGLPEVKRGILAGAGGIVRLPRAIPRAIALEMIASGESIDAARALALGLVNRVAGEDAMMDEALALAEKIAANAPLAVQHSLVVARAAAGVEEELWRLNKAAARIVLKSEDAREGPRAFMEKRKPVWTGR